MAVATAGRVELVHTGANVTVRAVVRILANEIHKNVLGLWAYRGTLIPELAVAAFTYLMLQFFIGGGRIVEELVPPTTLAYLAYLFTYYVLLKVVSGLLEEVNTGTLEQTHISPLPAWALSLGRVAAAMVHGGAVTLLVAAGLVLGLDVDVSLRWAALVPLALTVLDVVGFALLVGGLALSIASIGAVLHVVQGIVMILNGSLVPVEAFPGWLEVTAKLVPGTLGIEATRAVLFAGTDGRVWGAAMHAGVMLVAGWAVYQRAVWRGLAAGRLGP